MSVVAVHRAMPPSIAAGGLGVPVSGSLQLAGEHFAASMSFLFAGCIGLAWVAPEVAAGNYPSPHVAAITHLFTLGWLTTTIFGALYQLLPVALGSPIRWERLGHASFACFVPGVALFASGVATSRMALDHAGLGLIALGIVLALVNVVASLAGAKARDAAWWAIAVAITALASTMVLGVVLLHNVHTGFLAEARLRVLAVHLHVALIGWALMMIVGMSSRLLPMFLLSHGVDTRWTARAIVLLAAGVAALAAGLATQQLVPAWVGVALVEGGLACFIWQVRLFFRHRIRRRIDAGMRFVITALVYLSISAVLGPLVMALGSGYRRLAAAYVIAGLLGGIVLYVIGHFYKIVPFLAWIAHFRGRMGKEKVPSVADLYSSRIATVQWVLMSFALIPMTAGTLVGHAHCVRAGSVLFTIGMLLFASQVIRVARGPSRQQS